MDVFDIEIEVYEKNLTGDLNIELNECLKLIKKHEGIIILAHINKDKFSLKKMIDIHNIGFIDGIEVTKHFDDTFFKDYPLFKGIPVYMSSDSHTITSISRRTNYIELDELTENSVLRGLKR